MPHHLRPSTPYAADALLPGDPGRALALAQQLLIEPKMSNHAAGSGDTRARPRTAGRSASSPRAWAGPSAAIVLAELAELGVRRAIRVGTCGALDPGLALGDLLVREARPWPRTAPAAALGAERARRIPTRRSPRRSPTAAGSTPPRIVTTDLFYEQRRGARRRHDDWREPGAVAVEMEAATLFALGARLGVACACLLAVTDVFDGGGAQRGSPTRSSRRVVEPHGSGGRGSA